MRSPAFTIAAVFAAGCAALALAAPLAAQQPADTTVGRDSALKVFVDCPGFTSGCDLDFFRTEIKFVNYTNNPQDAAVHVLVSTQATGGGGTEYTVTFIGQHQFTGRADTLRYDAPANAPADDQRRGVARILKLGLAGYAATTPLAARLDVTYQAPTGAAAHVHDPWNHWVFRTSVNADLSGQQSFHSGFGMATLSANRVTDAWKLNFAVNGTYSENDFKLPVVDTLGNETGTETVRTAQRNYSFSTLIVKSAGGHWGLGANATVSHSTFSNEQFFARVAPAVEYDFFPYAQSTRQLLTLRYELGAGRFNYVQETLYGKTSETLFDESLTLSASARETWGTIDASLEAANYLQDFSKNHLTFFGGVNLNLYRGLSFNLSGSVSLQHDQLSLPLAGATAQDVLLQQHELATSFNYFTFVGFSFSFGSIFNNVVNPRFGNSNGGGITVSFSS